MTIVKGFITSIFLSFAILTLGQNINDNWKQNLTQSIDDFKKCDQNFVNGVNPRSKFIGEAVNNTYKVNDFYVKNLGRYMTGTEIITYLKQENQWKLVGHGYDQKALSEAQNYANENKAVVVAYLNDEQIGHVSLVLPGKLIKSGTWGYDVPNSASFFINDPQKSYLDKGLSYAFNRNMIRTLLIYVRLY